MPQPDAVEPELLGELDLGQEVLVPGRGIVAVERPDGQETELLERDAGCRHGIDHPPRPPRAPSP